MAEEQEDLPVFEMMVPSLIIGAKEPIAHIKVWGDGRVEGMRAFLQPGQSMVVVNRVPALIGKLMGPMQDYLNEVDGLRRALEANGQG